MRSRFTFLLLIAFSLFALNKGNAQPIPANIKGQAVASCFSGYVGNSNLNGIVDNYVIGIVDVHTPVGPGANWMPPMYHGPANSWKSSRLGQVYGIAIDKRNSIFTTATVVYGNPSSDAYSFGSAGSGGVYKLDGVTGMVTDLVTTVPFNSPITLGTSTSIPNGSANAAGPGLGNISYAITHDKLYVTNFEDGTIYRTDPITGIIDDSYDPVAPANPGSTSNSAMTVDATVQGWAPLGDRLWGIGFNRIENRIYYGVWVEDYSSATVSTYNIIRSVGLDASGMFLPATDIFEIALIDIPSNIRSMPVSDIAFNSDGNKMLIGERSQSGGATPGAHNSRVQEYSGNSTSWVFSQKISIGTAFDGKNNSGGVDYGYGSWDPQTRENLDCDSTIWATGDYMFNAPGFGMMYGLQRSPASGNTLATVNSTSYFVDLNGVGGTSDKRYIGDTEIFRDTCSTENDPGNGNEDPCKSISVSVKPWQSADGGCCWQLSIDNASPDFWTQMTATSLTSGVTFSGVTGASGWGVTNSGTFATWNPPSGFLPTGVQDSLILCLYSLVPPPQDIVISFIGADGTVCSDTLHIDCAEMPPPVPPCVEIVESAVECQQFGPNGSVFSWSFNINNNSPFSNAPYNYPAENVLVYPVTSGITVTPGSANFPPLGYGNTTAEQNFTISGPGAVSGATICIVVQLHGEQLENDYVWCCPPDTICIELPICEDCCTDFESEFIQEKLSYSGNGISNLVSNISVGPNPIVKTTATIVSAYRKNFCDNNPQWQPVYGVIQNAPSNLNGLPLVPGANPFGMVPPPLSAEAEWGTVPSGVTFNGANLDLDLQFPNAPSGYKCYDSLRFCVRYTFTDSLCVTCDTIICYEQKRRGKLIIFNPDGAVGVNIAELAMKDSHQGQLTIALPEANDEGDYLLSQISLKPEFGVKIVSMKSESVNADIIESEIAIAKLDLKSGSTIVFDLEFDNYAGLDVFMNTLVLEYMDLNSRETYSAEAIIEARTPNDGGKMDILATDDYSDRMNVQTFQIYFANMNFTHDSISKLRISLGDEEFEKGAKIIAFGPPEVDDEVIVGAFGDVGDNVRFNPLSSGEPTVILPEGEVRPMYITVAGLQDSTLNLIFQAVNSGGNVVTQADVKVENPLYTGSSNENDNPLFGFNDVDGLNLLQNFPNPTNGISTIQFYSVNNLNNVSLVITDLKGQVVSKLMESTHVSPGNHTVVFDGNNLPAGTYLYTLYTAKGKLSRTLNIVK